MYTTSTTTADGDSMQPTTTPTVGIASAPVEGLHPLTGRGSTSRGAFQEGPVLARGEVRDVVVMENRGFGFVTFEEPPSAQRFLEAHHHEIDKKQIEAKAAVPRRLGGCSQLTKKMFVGGTGEISDDEFRHHFDKYGVIEDAAIVRKDGTSRGFGFVTFRNEMSVEKCLVESQVLSNGRRVDIKRAVPRERLTSSSYSSPYDGSYKSSSSHAPVLYTPYPSMDYMYGGYGAGGYGYGILDGGPVGVGAFMHDPGYGLADSSDYRRGQSGRGGGASQSQNQNHSSY